MLRLLISLIFVAGLLLGQTTRTERIVICTDAGASDTYACTPTPTVSAYTTGLRVRLFANTANTGAASVNISTVGAIAIKKVGGGITTDLADNDIRAGQYVDLIYDGTNFQMLSQLGNAASGGATITCDPFDFSRLCIHDEFTHQVRAATSYDGEMPWAITTVGTSTAVPSAAGGTWPNIGVLKVTTASTISIGSGNSMVPYGSDQFAWGNNTNKTWAARFVFAFGQIVTHRSSVGFSSQGTGTPTIGFGLRHDTYASAKCSGADTTNFKFWAFNASGPSDVCIDTGVPADAARHSLLIYSDGTTNQKVWFQLDGGTAVSICSSGCTATATITTSGLYPFIQTITDATNTAAYFEMDYFSLIATLSANSLDRNP